MFPRTSYREKIILLIITTSAATLAGCSIFGPGRSSGPRELTAVTTFSNPESSIGEPFGIAVRGSDVFISDGVAGAILKLERDGRTTVVARGLNTPSGIAFLPEGDLVVADTGSHTLKKVSLDGKVEAFAGIENVAGSADGEARSATFNGPIGVVADENGHVFVADTYNDRIRRVASNGVVTTMAGSTRGFADGPPPDARFDTPLGLALFGDKLLVADSGNRRIRVVEPGGNVWTFAGAGDEAVRDGTPASAAFVSPTAVSVDDDGVIFVADGNAIRVAGRRVFPFIETLAGGSRGYADAGVRRSRFNRPSGIVVDDPGHLLIADSGNRAIRLIGDGRLGREMKDDEIRSRRVPASDFRDMQPPRWPYDPPDKPREIAGTLGEIRGEIGVGDRPVWFHNGLDIAGGYGEVARFIRTETVLDPRAADNFSTSRELLRMPSVGYIHINLGRDTRDNPVSDGRFQFERDAAGRIAGVRVPRGSTFRAGEILGTLNSMNHVHLIAGPSGAEMNALAALGLPGVSDSIPPVIENVSLFDRDWREIEISSRAVVSVRPEQPAVRVVARAYDRMDGNAERRRLGVFKLGYQILRAGQPLGEIHWTITFERMPANDAVRFVYSSGSKSGATGETVFNYIVTNRVSGDDFAEDFLDTSVLAEGRHTLRVFAADFSGNVASKDVDLEIRR